MKKNYTLIILLLVVAGGCKKETDLAPTTVGPSNVTTSLNKELQKFTTDYISSKYQLLINKGTDVKSLERYHADTKNASEEVSQIAILREGLSNKIDFVYTDFKVEITLYDIQPLGNQVSFGATEHYTLTSNQPDPDKPGTFIQPEGYYEHTFTVQKEGTSWKIITEACNDQPWAFNENPVMGEVPAESFSEGMENPKAYTYNPTAAKNFAYAYWSTPPGSPYVDFTSYGGDCTNFLSWCLKTGGWVMTSSWKFYSFGTRTASWASASSFKSYALSSGRIYTTNYAPSSLVVGDILQADWYPCNGSADHSMIVTKKVGSTIYLTYRSNNTKDKPFYNLPASAAYFAWKVKLSAN